MDKQSTIGFVLIGLVLVIWFYMNAPEPQPIETQKRNADSTLVTKDTAVQSPKPIVKETPEIEEPETAPLTGVFADDNNAAEEIITIENDVAIIELTNKGGSLRRYFLKDYNTWYYKDLPEDAPWYKKYVQLVNSQLGSELNIVFLTKDGQLVNTSDLTLKLEQDGYKFNVDAGDSLQLTYSYELGPDKFIKKHFTFYGDKYIAEFEVELINVNDIISGLSYDVMWNNGINFVEQNSVDEATYTNVSAYSGDEQVIIDASSMGDKESKDINGMVDWAGVRNKYFTAIISPDDPNSNGGVFLDGINTPNKVYGDREFYSIRYKVPYKGLKNQKDSFKLYIGPLVYKKLKSYDRNFEAIYDFGSFFGLKLITRPISEYILLPLFSFLHSLIPNYGFVIIVFSIIIKIVLYPLTKQSYKSMKRMQLLQPKIAEMKEKYKDDQQKVQKETMKLYSTYGINPAGGCLPMLLQMPILFALFAFFRVTIQIRHEPFIWWITDLSSPDIIYSLPFSIPLFGVDQISGLALLLGITMFFQQKMSVRDPSQKALVYVMPVMFTFMFMGFSSGLNLYYFLFNLLSIMQQYYINNKKDDNELVPVKDPKKKKGGGFMQRMMDAAEKQAQAQKQGAKKKKKF
jgi:YidC/Oxa1 family membrane protein insertase